MLNEKSTSKKELVTYSEPSPSRRALLRHLGDENALQDRDSPRTLVDAWRGFHPALLDKAPQQLFEAQKAPSQGCKDAPRCRKGRSGPYK